MTVTEDVMLTISEQIQVAITTVDPPWMDSMQVDTKVYVKPYRFGIKPSLEW